MSKILKIFLSCSNRHLETLKNHTPQADGNGPYSSLGLFTYSHATAASNTWEVVYSQVENIPVSEAMSEAEPKTSKYATLHHQ